MKVWDKYAEDVMNGNIVAGKNIILAVQRYYKMKEDDRFIFKEKRVEKVINFAKNLKHFAGKTNGQSFEFLPWQAFAVANIYGFFWKENGKRVTRDVYIQVARKNGKSSIIAALGLYSFLADGEASAEVDCVANSHQQAHILLEMAQNYAKSLDPKGKYIKQFRDSLKFPVNNSRFQCLASDSARLDGYSASVAIIDEFHEAPDLKLWGVLKTSQGFRENPLMIIITTAGFDLSKPCYEMRNTCIEILKELKEDWSQFSLIYELDDDDDFKDENVWAKSNPCLDQTVTKEYLSGMVIQASNQSSMETQVLTKNFNMWVKTMDTWINQNFIQNCTEEFNIDDFNSETQCYVGIDLSAVSDLTAVNYMFDYNDKLYFKTKYYLPEIALKDSPNKEKYKQWKKEGSLTITQGNVVDYDFILNDLIKMRNKVKIVKVCYDPYNSTQFCINATEQGLPMYPFSQSLGHFNRPTKDFERLVKSTDKIILENNPMTRWCFENVILKFDWNDNCKPIKGGGDNNKIDGVIAILESLGGYLETPKEDLRIV